MIVCDAPTLQERMLVELDPGAAGVIDDGMERRIERTFMLAIKGPETATSIL
jgi:hypothetical protein